MATYAQKKASQAYRERKKQKGEAQHLLYTDSQRWEIIKAINKVLKNIPLEDLTGIDIDDEGKYIRFIYDNQPKTRVVLTNQTQDDKSQLD